MKNIYFLLNLTLIVGFAFANIQAQQSESAVRPKKTTDQNHTPIALQESTALQNLVNQAATETINKFSVKGFKADNLAITLIDLRDPKNLKMGQFNGENKIYPASVVKMFYLIAFHQWLEEGKLTDSPSLRRAVKDMIVDSSNDATGFVVDILTGTSNGMDLPPEEAKTYADKREVVNRYLATLDYKNINVNQKTYCESLYGRERQFWNEGKNRNMLTTDATARALTEIVLGKAVNADRSAQMMELLKRDFAGESKDDDDQAHGFTGIALQNMPGAKLWSKAGWTTEARHDAAYVETPDGLKFVLVTYTSNFANERDIIPNIASIVLKNLGAVK